MLTITPDQSKALSEARIAAFVAEMRAHLAAHFPDMAGGPAQDQDIRAALATAAAHGLTSRRDGCRFLNLAACFGWDFIARPDCAWMAAMLRDETLGGPSARLQRLTEEAIARLQRDGDDARARDRTGDGARPWLTDLPGPDDWGDHGIIDTPDGLS